MATKPKTTTAPEGAAAETKPTESKAQDQSLVILEGDPMAIAPAQLRARTELETEKRKILTDYISANMKDGVDYGTIKFGGKESKPTLFKPGAEKFCSLFGIRATFRKDQETWEMLGSKAGVIAFVCELKTKGDVLIGEGRGVTDLNEKQSWTMNNAVKIAQKRAQIDAVLRSGGLSDFFTQDLEDQPDEGYKPRAAAPSRPTAPNANYMNVKLTQPQMSMLFGLMKKANQTKEQFEAYLLKNFNVIGIENTPKFLASKIIDGLIKKYGYPEKEQPAVAVPIEPKDELPTINLDEAESEAQQEDETPLP